MQSAQGHQDVREQGPMALEMPLGSGRSDAGIPELDIPGLLQRVDESGVERETGEDETNPDPFDPSKVDVDLRTLSLDLLMRRMREDEINLSPDFQRHQVWSPEARSRLVESILIRIPLPAFYIDGTNDAQWVVVDGLQRLSTVKLFAVENEMVLGGLEFLTQFNGLRFKELPRDLRRRFEETQVNVYLIRPGTPENVKFNIFKRINTGGMPLSPQEIRHALNQGKAAVMIAELAKSQEFLKATAHGLRDRRMTDREFVLRFLAFFEAPCPPMLDQDFDFFLHQAMKHLNAVGDPERTRLEQEFLRAMDIAHALFGNDAFRKRLSPGAPRNPLNKALFESWSVALARLNESEVARLIERKAALLTSSMALTNNLDFSSAISQGTNSPRKIKLRFEKVKEVIEEVLSA
jgi:hypothetical protein